MDMVIGFIIGVIVGVVFVALAVELGMKKTSKGEPASRPTQKWSLSEIKNPRIVAEYLGDVALPKNAKVVVNQYNDKEMFKGIEAREHAGIKGNFVLGDDRALILAGPIKNQEIGVWTVEKEVLHKLNAYFEDSWSKASQMKFDEKK